MPFEILHDISTDGKINVGKAESLSRGKSLVIGMMSAKLLEAHVQRWIALGVSY